MPTHNLKNLPEDGCYSITGNLLWLDSWTLVKYVISAWCLIKYSQQAKQTIFQSYIGLMLGKIRQ